MSTPRIFIVGCPRSGTTLLQSMLAAHPEVVSFPETHFFARLRVRRRRGVSFVDLPEARSEFGKFLAEIDRADLLRYLPRFVPLTRPVVRGFSRALDEVAQAAGASTWVEKTPVHLRRLAWIEEFMPVPYRVIHLVRSGEDTVASLYKATNTYPDIWGGARSIEACVQRWVEDIERTRGAMRRAGHAVVFYGDLVDRPREVLERLCEFVGLPYRAEMLAHFSDKSASLMRKRESSGHKSKHSKDLEGSGRPRAETGLSPSQLEQVRAATNAVDLSELRACALV